MIKNIWSLQPYIGVLRASHLRIYLTSEDGDLRVTIVFSQTLCNHMKS